MTRRRRMKISTIRRRLAEATAERRAAIRAMRDEGHTWEKIGEEFAVTRQRAQQIGKTGGKDEGEEQ